MWRINRLISLNKRFKNLLEKHSYRSKGWSKEGYGGEIYLEIHGVEEGRGDIPRDPRVGGKRGGTYT